MGDRPVGAVLVEQDLLGFGNAKVLKVEECPVPKLGLDSRHKAVNDLMVVVVTNALVAPANVHVVGEEVLLLCLQGGRGVAVSK